MEPEELQRRMQEAELARQEIENQLKQSQLPDAKEKAGIERARIERAKDLDEGRKRGEQLFGTGSMGRYSQDVQDRINAQANGFTPEELNAMRDNNIGTIQQAGQGNLRALRIQQAAQGVRGPQAVAQQAKLQRDQQGQMVGSERELFLKNIDARRAGLGEQMNMQKFNMDQANREKQAQLTTEMGYGSLGAADRGAVMQRIVGEQQAAASAHAGGGGKK